MKSSPKLELSFQLYRLHWLIERMAEQELQAELGMGFAQFKIIKILHHHPEACGKDIAGHLQQTQAGVSRQIDLLVKAGLIERQENAENRREHILVLTPKGNQVAEAGVKTLTDTSHRLFGDLIAPERAELERLLGLVFEKAKAELGHDMHSSKDTATK